MKLILTDTLAHKDIAYFSDILLEISGIKFKGHVTKIVDIGNTNDSVESCTDVEIHAEVYPSILEA